MVDDIGEVSEHGRKGVEALRKVPEVGGGVEVDLGDVSEVGTPLA